MKTIKLVTLTALAALAMASTLSAAQNSANTSANATARIITPISIAKTADLNFGDVVASGVAGTVAVDVAGARTSAGGASLGKAKNPKTWEVGYNYVKLEKDATLGMFTDDDRFNSNGTDSEGHRFYGKYQITKNLQACATFFLDKKNISDPAKEADVNHLCVDLMASF